MNLVALQVVCLGVLCSLVNADNTQVHVEVRLPLPDTEYDADMADTTTMAYRAIESPTVDLLSDARLYDRSTTQIVLGHSPPSRHSRPYVIITIRIVIVIERTASDEAERDAISDSVRELYDRLRHQRGRIGEYKVDMGEVHHYKVEPVHTRVELILPYTRYRSAMNNPKSREYKDIVDPTVDRLHNYGLQVDGDIQLTGLRQSRSRSNGRPTRVVVIVIIIIVYAPPPSNGGVGTSGYYDNAKREADVMKHVIEQAVEQHRDRIGNHVVDRHHIGVQIGVKVRTGIPLNDVHYEDEMANTRSSAYRTIARPTTALLDHYAIHYDGDIQLNHQRGARPTKVVIIIIIIVYVPADSSSSSSGLIDHATRDARRQVITAIREERDMIGDHRVDAQEITAQHDDGTLLQATLPLPHTLWDRSMTKQELRAYQSAVIDLLLDANLHYSDIAVQRHPASRRGEPDTVIIIIIIIYRPASRDPPVNHDHKLLSELIEHKLVTALDQQHPRDTINGEVVDTRAIAVDTLPAPCNPRNRECEMRGQTIRNAETCVMATQCCWHPERQRCYRK